MTAPDSKTSGVTDLTTVQPDIEIARSVAPQSILLLAQQRLGLPPESLIPFGHYKAKVDLGQIDLDDTTNHGKLVLVTAVTPTPAGEGKTTTSVGLNDALNRLGHKSTVCLREPSLGPCFGMKGGAAGGGYSQIIPMEDINLHFNGDFHAITSAHNLLAALIDNHIHWGNELDIDPRQVTWKRVVDLNDRSLRYITQGLGGTAHGVPRESGFDITVASEIMAILCLAESVTDLEDRLSKIVIGRRRDKSLVTVADLGAAGSMTVLLKDALHPNLVQSLEHNPAFVHGGPFANIAHGCNSVSATRAALALNDIVVTEAGFGADLGAEKFIDIKCRQSGLRPDAAVLVCTLRAIKMQGGVAKENLATPNPEAIETGFVNLQYHIENLQQFGLQPIICINRFPTDTTDELKLLLELCRQQGVQATLASHWADGGAGASELADMVVKALQEDTEIEMIYEDTQPLHTKVEAIAKRIYRASGVDFTASAARDLQRFEEAGFGHLPVCIAKTQYSLTVDPKQTGALPEQHRLPVREVRLCAGAGFVVIICGDIMTMPGLPRSPAALDIGLNELGEITGLF